jgi:putative membrane protein
VTFNTSPFRHSSSARGRSGRDDKHPRIARWTFPFWLDVGVTGGIVYLMLYHL